MPYIGIMYKKCTPFDEDALSLCFFMLKIGRFQLKEERNYAVCKFCPVWIRFCDGLICVWLAPTIWFSFAGINIYCGAFPSVV